MNLQFVLVISTLIFLFSCNSNKESSSSSSFDPKVAEAKGYVVPKDQISPPNIIPAGTYREGLSHNDVGSIMEDKSSHLWFGTRGEGVTNYDGKNFIHFTVEQGLINNTVGCMLQDKRGNYWFGTYEGVNKFNGKNFTHFREKEGLVNNDVWSIQEDKTGNIWFGTSFGLSKLDRDKLSANNQNGEGVLFKNYTYDDGFLGIGVNLGKTIYQAQDSTFWIGALDMLTAFHTGGEQRYNLAPNLQIAGLTLFNEKIPWQGFVTTYEANSHNYQMGNKDTSIWLGNGVRVHDIYFDSLSRWNGVPEHLSLAYDNNNITIQYVGISLQSPKKVKYQYQLEGQDQNWSSLTSRSEATYANLPHGKYLFKIKGMNGEGIWSKELNYSFLVRPPWWHTWWAYSVYGILGISFLISLRQYAVKRERMKHELKIQTLEAEKIHEIDHLESRFFASISHEFRTQLTLILGHLDKFLAGSPKNNLDHTAYQMMHRDARRLKELINHLLYLSKLEAGNMKLDLKPADLLTFLKAMVFSFTTYAESKVIQYHFKYAIEHAIVFFDEDKLEKIITNLLSNAFKFTKPGGIISVKASIETFDKKLLPDIFSSTAHLSAARMLEIRVQDSGIGIAQDQLDSIFDRFYQADTSTARKQEGRGIGLSLVRELVELYSGEIKVESGPGQGSCITVRIPVLLTDFKDIAITGPALNNDQKSVNPINDTKDIIPSPDSATANDNPEAPLVLILEDNADIRSLIRGSLQPFYQIIEAADGNEGYNKAVQTIPDLILSDVIMPKMNGVDLCRKLKKNEKTSHIPVVLLSAKCSGEDRRKGLETGADDYLIKPFEALELLVRIKNLIENRRKLREHFSRKVTLQPSSIAISSVDEQFLQRSMQIIEAHMSDATFGVETFSKEVAMSRMQLFRKLKVLTNHSPGDFIRIMRLKRAAELLSLGAGTIAEVAFMVGFNEPSYFTKCFQKEFGHTPSEFVANSTLK